MISTLVEEAMNIAAHLDVPFRPKLHLSPQIILNHYKNQFKVKASMVNDVLERRPMGK